MEILSDHYVEKKAFIATKKKSQLGRFLRKKVLLFPDINFKKANSENSFMNATFPYVTRTKDISTGSTP